MNFLQPLALLGLVAGAIPAILHLMARRIPPVVDFPAMRYIEETEKVISRRLKLRNLLLLLLRTLAIVSIVLALARPILDLGFGRDHRPTAVALIVDNSMSSGSVSGGATMLSHLVIGAREVIDELGVDDELWLVLSDGVAKKVTGSRALAILDTLTSVEQRLDIGEAVRAVAISLTNSGLPETEIVVLSDLQRTALSDARNVAVRVVFLLPPPPPSNRGIDSVRVVPTVWFSGGEVVARVTGTEGDPVAVRLVVSGRSLGRAVVNSGERVTVGGTPGERGWLVATLEIDADELRSDDVVDVPILVADPVSVEVREGAGEFLSEAIGVLLGAGKVRAGDDVVLGTQPVSGAVSVIFPPEDASMVGATNRTLEDLGVSWRYGQRQDGEWLVEGEVDAIVGNGVFRRQLLRGTGSVLATVGGEPWIVRDGDVVLVGSRLDAGTWTTLPAAAGFVPFVDQLVNRIAGRSVWISFAGPGTTMILPSSVTSVAVGANRMQVEPGQPFSAPATRGVYFLIGESGDTVGAVSVTHDPRESELVQATPEQVRASFGNATVEDRLFNAALFGGAGLADLTTFFIVVATLAALAELILASETARESS